jgi:hypothetical protein
MSTRHNDEYDGGTALALTAIGGGGVLLWLLLRARGRRRGGPGNGTESHSANEHPIPRREVLVVVRAGDRVDVDGVTTDLATTVTLARAAGTARFHVTGDARQGWVSKVYYGLVDAGVAVSADAGITDHLIRYDDKKKPGASTAPPSQQAPAAANPATPIAALDRAHTSVAALSSIRAARTFLADVRNASKFSSSQSCPPRVSGGGALVRSSYRVPPFLADDVLLVEDDAAKTKGRVYCVAYDLYWKERIPERKGWLDRDTLSPAMRPGMHVELSPLCPLWVRGAKYGTIQQVTKDWTVVVKMDDPRVRRLQRFTDHTQLTVRESPAESA